MVQTIRVIQYGLGPIGSAIARLVVERAGLELVGAVDIDAAKVGKDAGTVMGAAKPLGFPVVSSLAQALARAKADVVIHSTSSYFEGFGKQIIECVQAGLNVVSTAEELSFPWLANAQEAKEIDQAARQAGKAVLATGINPGFLMDALPLFLTGICQQVKRIEIIRNQNAALRRGPFQVKIGCGLTVAEFNARMQAGRMGHVGLVQSIGMVFDTLGQKMDGYESSVEAVVAAQAVETPYVKVAAGQVKGLRQIARGYAKDGLEVQLVFIAALGAENECDIIRITGKPDLEVTLKGTNGDVTTAAIIVNAVRRIVQAAPGLWTMRDMPPVTVW